MWARLLNFALGLWLMAAPAILDYHGAARLNDRIVGAIVAGASFIAIWEVTRSLRWVSFLMGLWLVIAPMILLVHPADAIANSYLVGLSVAGLSTVRGRIRGRMGGERNSLPEG